MNARRPFGLAIIMLSTAAGGCGFWGGDDDQALTDGLPKIESPVRVEKTAPAAPAAPVATAAETTAETTTTPAAPPVPAEHLELKLKVGDRFPLIKTIEQNLTQQTPQGPVTSRSRLQMLLALTVEEVRDGKKRLAVRYHRVRYFQDLAGERLEYDSSAPTEPLPLEVRAYHGLIDNTFSFWIGPDNRLLELVGFNDFLERCVDDIPETQRRAVMTKLIETSGDEGIANFVDDSLGLLPEHDAGDGKGAIIQVGATWPKERQVLRPIPMYLSSQCTLRRLTEQTAEIDVVGSVRPSATYGRSDQETKDVRITVRGGHLFGTCTLDRQTGLPLKSRIEQHVAMNVRLAAGTEFEQTRRTITTIEAFPEQQTASASGAVKAQ